MKKRGGIWARNTVLASMIPFGYVFLAYSRGLPSKLMTFFVFLCFLSPMYDFGLLFNFFAHGPRFFRDIQSLDEDKSFGKIQTELFLRVCARKEIEKAVDPTKRKTFTELIFARTLRNSLLNIKHASTHLVEKIKNKA